MMCLAVLLLLSGACLTLSEDPKGHLQPLGSHMPPKQVETRDTVPNPIDFFNKYVKPGIPVLLKGAGKSLPAFEKWKDDQYLRNAARKWIVQPEIGKKENRSLGEIPMSFGKFLDIYKEQDLYLVEDVVVPNPLAKDISLLKCMVCGGFKEHFAAIIMWFSSGGTKSVLHIDQLENMNCLMDGSKDIVLFERKHKDVLPLNWGSGYSSLDVDKVDLYKYNSIQNLSWYSARLEAGDCFYTPYSWSHYVKSSNTRNLAVNVWWYFMKKLTHDDCPANIDDVPNTRTIQDVRNAGQVARVRSDFLGVFADTDDGIPTSTFNKYFIKHGRSEQDAQASTELLDTDGDGFVTVEEMERAPDEVLLRVGGEDQRTLDNNYHEMAEEEIEEEYTKEEL